MFILIPIGEMWVTREVSLFYLSESDKSDSSHMPARMLSLLILSDGKVSGLLSSVQGSLPSGSPSHHLYPERVLE